MILEYRETDPAKKGFKIIGDSQLFLGGHTAAQ